MLQTLSTFQHFSGPFDHLLKIPHIGFELLKFERIFGAIRQGKKLNNRKVGVLPEQPY
jgi:hypothetical protein